MTYRYVVYDLQKSFNSTFDDAHTTLPQILYWVTVIANKLMVQQNLATNSDLFTSVFNSVEVFTDENGRSYIDLPTQIMDLPNNSGIVYITYNLETCKCEGPAFAQKWFQGVNLGAVQHLYLDEYTKPSTDNPYFYRIAHSIDGVNVNRIYLLGLECIEIEDVEIAIKSTIDPSNICDLDAEIPLPNELIQDLMTQVLQLGKFVTLMPADITNTGADERSTNEAQYSAKNTTLPDSSSTPTNQ